MCMTKEYSRISDLQRIKTEQSKDDFVRYRSMKKEKRKNWWPKEILIATFLSNKNIKDKKRK